MAVFDREYGFFEFSHETQSQRFLRTPRSEAFFKAIAASAETLELKCCDGQ